MTFSDAFFLGALRVKPTEKVHVRLTFFLLIMNISIWKPWKFEIINFGNNRGRLGGMLSMLHATQEVIES